jgi:hypothetical protein
VKTLVNCCSSEKCFRPYLQAFRPGTLLEPKRQIMSQGLCATAHVRFRSVLEYLYFWHISYLSRCWNLTSYSSSLSYEKRKRTCSWNCTDNLSDELRLRLPNLQLAITPPSMVYSYFDASTSATIYKEYVNGNIGRVPVTGMFDIYSIDSRQATSAVS